MVGKGHEAGRVRGGRKGRWPDTAAMADAGGGWAGGGPGRDPQEDPVAPRVDADRGARRESDGAVAASRRLHTKKHPRFCAPPYPCYRSHGRTACFGGLINPS